MVRGLKKFSEYFTGLEGSYVLIGAAGVKVDAVINRIKEAFGL